MPFSYDKPPAGDYVSLSDFAKLSDKGEVLKVGNGFLIDEPHNTYNGDALPRFVIVGTVSTGETVKVSSPTGADKGKDYSRNGFLRALDAYLKANPSETVDIKFLTTKGSRYIDIEQA